MPSAAAGARVVIEEFLEGEEASFLAFTDGKAIIPLASAQDHKPVFDGDQGPNTGGMGAYSPAPVVTPAIHEQAMDEVMRRAVDGMAAEGRPYRGVLYAGLMIKDGEVKTLEFNARFGDPECQPLLMRLKSDIVPVLLACARGDLAGIELEWHDQAAVCVVMASGGYPGDFAKGLPIAGLDAGGRHRRPGGLPCRHRRAGTGRSSTAAAASSASPAAARRWPRPSTRPTRGCSAIRWEGVHYRTDIGRKALER